MDKDLEILQRKIAREKIAREEAEKLLEEKSLELYESNQKLKSLNNTLKVLLEDSTDKLQKTEQEYQSLVESINDIICKTSLDGIITYLNPVAEATMGYSNKELLGKSVFFLICNRLQKKAKQFYTHHINKGNCSTYNEIPLKTKDGKKIWLGLSIQFFSNNCKTCTNRPFIISCKSTYKARPDCHFKEVVIVARDISEQKIIQKLLTTQSRKLEKGLLQQELLSEIALELNSLNSFEDRINNTIQMVGKHTNAGRVFIFEDSNSGLSTSNTCEWCRPGISNQKEYLQDLYYENYPSWNKIMDNKGLIYAKSIASLPNDLKPILEQLEIKSLVVYPLIVKNKRIGFIGFVETKHTTTWSKSDRELLRTISGMVSATYERAKMEQSLKLERDKANIANRAKTDFLANMSHEIRTPMNAILGFSEALFQTVEEGKDKEMIKSIVSSGKLLLSILNDILDFSKIEAGKTEIVKQPTDLRHIISEISQLFSNESLKKGLDLVTKINSNVPNYLLLDENRIKQVCLNLVGNAIKFTHKGYVKITANYIIDNEIENYGTLLISVCDTGIGIDKSQINNIFESFKQQSGQANRKYGGTGLGLAISRKLIEIMGGTISVESKIEEGSTFTIRIPDIKISNSKKDRFIDEDENLLEKITFDEKDLLIVDDINENIQIISSLLSTFSFKIKKASDGTEAMNLLSKHSFNLILLDIRLPGINGFEMAKFIRNHHSKTKIIAYTASVVDITNTEEFIYFDDALLKPVQYNTLISILKKHLKFHISDLEKKEQKEFVNNELVIPNKLTQDLHKVVNHLNTVYIPQWYEIKDHLILYKIEDFNNNLTKYAKSIEFDYLLNYSNRIKEHIDLVDLEQLKDQLQLFPDIINQLENYN